MKGVGNAVLYTSKKDVDRHVEDLFAKLNNEHEKNLKGLAIARMYFRVFEYELAKRYVATFLSVNEHSPEGHRLLGHCYDKLDNKEKAVAEYQKSLALMPNQPELLLSCCKLMIDPSVQLNEVQAEKICKQTEDLYPYHPTVFKLKERLLTSNGNSDTSKVESLLTAEISARPEDINLRIKQIKLFESSGRLSEAYSYAINIEKTSKIQEYNVEWYEVVSMICEAYGSSVSVNWEFYSHVLPIYEHTAALIIMELKSSKKRSVFECYKVLFRLDQALYMAIQLSSPKTEFYRTLLQHVSNQFYFHLGSLIMKSAKIENSISWYKSNQLAAPLFLMSLAPPINKQVFENISNSKDLNMERKTTIALWELEGTRRIIESGFVLRAMMAKEDVNFIDNIKLLCINDWKITNYKKIFNGPEYTNGISTSFFIHYSPDKLVYNIPELIQYAVPKHMLSFELTCPGSLHHLVWYGIQLLECENKGSSVRLTKSTVFPIGFGCKSFKELPLATNSFATANIDSLCQIDLNTFLYATVFSVASFLDNQLQKSDSKAPLTFPSNITDQLTTPEQENWWHSMYKIYSKNVDVKYVMQLRKIVTQGLESIRLIGNHGIDVQLMVYLAKNFSSQANKIIDNFLLKEGLEKRAVHYWEIAIQLLERISQLGIEQKSKNTLFQFYRKKLTQEEINELLEEGKFFLACHLMNNDKKEEAIEAFKKIHSPYASFYQAMVYKKILKSENETYADNTLPEANVILSKIKELFNITKERIKNDFKHPLHLQLKEEILELQMDIDLNGTTNNQYNADFLSENDYGEVINMSKKKVYNRFGERSSHNATSTPIQSPHTCSSRRILEDESNVKMLNELKVALQSQNVQCQTLGLQYYNMVEAMRIISEKVDKLFDNFNNTKESIFNKMNEMTQNISIKNSTSTSCEPTTDNKLIERIDKLEENLIERISAINEIMKDRQDDLYDVYQENEQFDKITYDQASCIQNTFDDQTQLPAINFPTTQLPTINFPTTQLPFTSTLPFQQFGLFNQVCQSNTLPTCSLAPNPNVNITSSDTLPTGPPVSQPPLSVIIPTHHILSGNLTTSEALSSFSFKFNQQNNLSQSVITHSTPSIQSTPSTSLSKNAEIFSTQPSISTFKESFETSLNRSKNSATDDSYTEEHDPIPEFQPIIPLPDKIEEVTGEENDTILFEQRAKLYKYVDKEWKEKGVGILKILKNIDTQRVRLVMRRDQVHKVCANHFLYDNMELKPKGDRAVLWSANDFSDAVKVQLENLCARFKTAEDCKEFTRIFNENKQPRSQNNSLLENSNADNFNELIIETKKDSCLTLSSENEKSLKHELGGFTFSTPPIINEIHTPKQQDDTPEKPKGLFYNLSFSSQTETPPQPSLKSILSKSTNLEADNNESSLNVSKSGLFTKETVSTSTELFSFNKTDKSALFTPKLDFTPGISATSYFSTLAKNSPNNIGFTNSPDFKGFPGAGSTIFNVKTNPSPHAIIKPESTSICSNDSVCNDSSSQPNDESEDFVPTAEFTPVIPLPKKVDVVTGEEGLEIIFDDRAKLLRFDSNTKEWKEKGIGQMKILYSSKDGYYQLLMRREVILKVCCNQRLTADLELKPVSSSDKAMSWIGQDFSEGESKKELFAIRFKTIGQLHAFRDKFNEVKDKIQEPKAVYNEVKNVIEKQSGNKPDSTKKELPKLSDLPQFKPKPGSWSCDACYLSNDANTLKCLACNTIKPGAIEPISENKSSTGFTFGQSTFPSMFKFGDATTNSQSTIPFIMPKFDASSEISFGSLSISSNTNVFNTENIKSATQKKPLSWREESVGLVKYDSDKSDQGSDETDNDSDGYDEQISVVENQKNQFGISNVKIEKSSFAIDNMSTFFGGVSLKKSENQVIPDAPEGNINSSELENDIESVKILDVKSLKDVVSHDDQIRATDLQLPLSFFLYKSKPKCKGCVGCEHDSDNEEEIVEQKIEKITSKTDSEKENDKLKKQDTSSVCITGSKDSLINSPQPFNPTTSFLFGDKSSTSLFEKTTSNASLFGSKPIFGGFSTNSIKTDDNKSTSLFGSSSVTTPSTPKFGTLSTPGSTESQITTPNALFSKTDDIKSNTENIFSFSSKTDGPFKFGEISKDPKLVFGQNLIGAVKPVDDSTAKVNPCAGNFNLNKSTDEEKNSEKDEEEVDNSHDPHFEPIIPLPDAIEISTGEENETILFCERSKLFRKDGNEYKERGIGEMKILYYPERNTYRFLFRREKVFKVVCNHLVTSDIILVPMKSSNKAFCWACMNTTEDTPVPQKELLAVRFKNEEIADKFKQVFDNCISKLST